jgi:hypothetical protein
MAWTEITRLTYQRDGLRYASDTVDAEWAVIDRTCRCQARHGRTRETNLGDVVDSIFYMAQPGRQWYLCPGIYPHIRRCSGISMHAETMGCAIGRRVGMIVHPANVQDRDGAPDLLASVRNAFPWLRHVLADGGYASVKLMSRASGGRLSAIMEPNPHAKLELWRCWSDSSQTLIRSRAHGRERAPRTPPCPTAMRLSSPRRRRSSRSSSG